MKKIILGIAGEISSGKGTVAKHIVENHNGSAHGFSTSLRDVAKRMYLEENRENLQKISSMFRGNFHEDILSKVIYHDVSKDKHEIIVIDGVRRMGDIRFLEKLPGFKLVYLEADMETRYERIVERGQNTDDATKTFEEFKKDNHREAEAQIKSLKEKSSVVIDNNGSFEELFAQIDKIIRDGDSK